jgi:hypothetical protein
MAITITRFDTFHLPKVSKTTEGYLRGSAVVSRSGVFEYANLDGSIRRELRHPDDVFKLSSLDTLKMIPITDDHPNALVNVDNANTLQVGYTGETYKVDGDNIVVSLTVTKKDSISKISSGRKCAISLGYSTNLVKESGTYKGERYDYRQTNVVYNHVALVDAGRAGIAARFRMDGKTLIDSDVSECNFTRLDEGIFNIKEDEMSNNPNEHQVDRSDAMELLKTRYDASLVEKELLVNKLTNSVLKVEALEKSLAKVNADLATEKEKNDPTRRAKETMDRVEMFARSAPYIDIEAYLHHDARSIMVAALNSGRTQSINFDGKSDEYISGMFETLIGTSYKANNIDTSAVFGVLSQKCDTQMQNTTPSIFKTHMESKKGK